MGTSTNKYVLGRDVKVYITTENISTGLATNSSGVIVGSTGTLRTQDNEIPRLGPGVGNDQIIDNKTALEISTTHMVEQVSMDNQDTKVPIKGPKRWSLKVTKARNRVVIVRK